MCQIFIHADPQLYQCRARSLRLHGLSTSLRLENVFWQALEEIGRRDGLSVGQLITRLYDELLAEGGDVSNFTSFLRVSCMRYLALQLQGAIPSDTRISIRSLNAAQVLQQERSQAWVAA